MSGDYFDLMRELTSTMGDTGYLDAWMRLAVHLAESHPGEAAAYVRRMSDTPSVQV